MCMFEHRLTFMDMKDEMYCCDVLNPRGGDLVQKYVPENGMDMKIHP